MSASRGFGGRVLYVEETTPGTTPTDPDYKKLSDHVESCTVSLDPATKEYRDIGSYDVASFILGLPAYGLRVGYKLHTDRFDVVDGGVDRQADNSLKSYSFEVAVNLDGTTQSYYTFKGGKVESTSLRGSVGEAVMVEHTIKALSVSIVTSEPSVGTGSRETSALGALSVYSGSTITRGGSAVAYITRAFELSVSHSLSVEGTDNQTDPKEIFEGARQVSGRCDITIDDGGKTLADTVLAGTEAAMTFAFGSTGALEVGLTGVRWQNLDIPLDTQEGCIKQNVPFRAKTAAATTVS